MIILVLGGQDKQAAPTALKQGSRPRFYIPNGQFLMKIKLKTQDLSLWMRQPHSEMIGHSYNGVSLLAEYGGALCMNWKHHFSKSYNMKQAD